MIMPSMGTVANQVKSMALNFKWKERKENPLMPKEGDSQRDMYIKQLQQQQKQQQLSSIDAKMKSGMRLSPADMDYLRKNAPDVYKKAADIEKEREQYRRELEQCKTKEDVEKLNLSRINGLMSEAKAVRNSSMPVAEKREKLEYIAMRAASIRNEHAEFTNTPDYEALPETREEAEEDGKDKRGKKISGEKPNNPFKDVNFGDSPGDYDSLKGLLAEAGIDMPEAGNTASPSAPAQGYGADGSPAVGGSVSTPGASVSIKA